MGVIALPGVSLCERSPANIALKGQKHGYSVVLGIADVRQQYCRRSSAVLPTFVGNSQHACKWSIVSLVFQPDGSVSF